MNDTLYRIAIWLIPLVIAIVFHEVAHGYVARMLGDRTAADRGRLTLIRFAMSTRSEHCWCR